MSFSTKLKKNLLNVHFYTSKVRTLCIQKYILLHLQRQRLKYSVNNVNGKYFFFLVSLSIYKTILMDYT